MISATVTLTTSAQPVFPSTAGAKRVYAAWVEIYNSSATDAIYWGGEGITSSTGIKLAAATLSPAIYRSDNRICLNQLFLVGTASGDTAIINYEPA